MMQVYRQIGKWNAENRQHGESIKAEVYRRLLDRIGPLLIDKRNNVEIRSTELPIETAWGIEIAYTLEATITPLICVPARQSNPRAIGFD